MILSKIYLEELRKPLKSSVWIPRLGEYLNLEHPKYEAGVLIPGC
jgi:hypothetical protein